MTILNLGLDLLIFPTDGGTSDWIGCVVRASKEHQRHASTKAGFRRFNPNFDKLLVAITSSILPLIVIRYIVPLYYHAEVASFC